MCKVLYFSVILLQIWLKQTDMHDLFLSLRSSENIWQTMASYHSHFRMKGHMHFCQDWWTSKKAFQVPAISIIKALKYQLVVAQQQMAGAGKTWSGLVLKQHPPAQLAGEKEEDEKFAFWVRLAAEITFNPGVGFAWSWLLCTAVAVKNRFF